jgi:hypothetical protein
MDDLFKGIWGESIDYTDWGQVLIQLGLLKGLRATSAYVMASRNTKSTPATITI